MPAIKRGTLGALKARSSTYATWRKSGMEDTSWRGLMSNMIRARGAKASPCGMEVWTCSGVGCTAFPKHSHRTWWPHTNIKMLAHSSGNPCSCMFSMAKPGWTKSKHLEKSKEARTSWFSNASLSCLHAVAPPGISSLHGTARGPETQSIPEPVGSSHKMRRPTEEKCFQLQ